MGGVNRVLQTIKTKTMAKIGLGSVVKVVVNVEGLTTQMLTDDSVDINAYFYGEDNASKKVVINKSQMVNEDEQPTNTLFCIVPTSSLATGNLTAEIEVKYPVEGSEDKLVQRSTIVLRDADNAKITLTQSVIPVVE